MYYFEGDFRTKPVQALGGASGTEEKSVLLQRARLERQKRESARRENHSAIIIQSGFRSYRARGAKKDECRNLFDMAFLKIQKIKDYQNTAITCVRYINFFFTKNKDEERLVGLCQYIVRHQKSLLAEVGTASGCWYRQLRKLLVLCCQYLEEACYTGWNMTSALRMLEIFTDIHSLPDAAAANLYSTHVVTPLCTKVLYRALRAVLDSRVPEVAQASAQPPTELAGLLLRLSLQPLAESAAPRQARLAALLSFSREMLARPYSPQINDFLLLALASAPQFPVLDFLEAVSTNIASESSSDQEQSPWLLHAIMVLMRPKLDCLDEAASWLYMKFVSSQLSSLSPPRDVGFLQSDDSDSENDEMSDGVENDLESEVRCSCLRMLTDSQQEHLFATLAATADDDQKLSSVCRLCHELLFTRRHTVHGLRLLARWAYSPQLVRRLWHYITSLTSTSLAGTCTSLLELLSRGIALSPPQLRLLAPALDTFCSLYGHCLISLYDTEFYSESEDHQSAFDLPELAAIGATLRGCCLGLIEVAHPESRPFASATGYNVVLEKIGVRSSDVAEQKDLVYQLKIWTHLFRSCSTVLRQLYTRDSRRRFCPLDLWTTPQPKLQTGQKSQLYKAYQAVDSKRPFGTFSNLNTRSTDDDFQLSTNEARTYTILTELPFIVNFRHRLEIYHELLGNDKRDNQGEMHHFNAGKFISISARRNFLYEDAFDRLSPQNEPDLHLHMRVQLRNFAGLDEAGIDGGGLFREFMAELLKAAFDPNRGFFVLTSDNLLYPNPAAKKLFSDYLSHYFFIGRILGKALYENLLVELPFATFFLAKLLSRYHGDVDIHHLHSLDPELYKNLLSLKTYSSDLSELGLDFTITSSELGHTEVQELIPGGRHTPVTRQNLTLYLHKVADYKLNKQIRAQCSAFRAGLGDVMNVELLRMFDASELQTLVSGAEVPIDLSDLRRHTNYSGGYTAEHPFIQQFWDVVSAFSDEKKRRLLKFVTSCSRPPLLGFKDLFPAFCIQRAGDESQRLPTASTCMNLLKLPEFPDRNTLQEKLNYALDSGAGFELS